MCVCVCAKREEGVKLVYGHKLESVHTNMDELFVMTGDFNRSMYPIFV